MTEPRQIVYKPAGPVAQAFHDSDAFIRGLLGPIGSGKSVAMCMEIVRRAFQQQHGPDGIRRTRWAIARNTYPELASTTIRTWLDWFPESIFGKVRWQPPITQHLKLAKDVELEVNFLAMDKPDDIKKLLSLEVTGVWLNEAREFPKAILDGATGRVGRYPKRADGGCTWAGVIADTNPPDIDHWWAKLALTPDVEALEELSGKLVRAGAIEPGQPLMEFFQQPGGTHPDAENIENIRPGYYHFASIGKSADWINVYVDGQYGSIADGRPVFPEFCTETHVSPIILEPDRSLPLVLGWDFGLTPACIVTQVNKQGQLRVLQEIIGDNIALSQFAATQVKPIINGRYQGMKIISLIDPAGVERSQADAKTCRDVLRFEGYNPSAAYSNANAARREAVVQYLTRLVMGKPGFLIDSSCKTLIRGLGGQYKYKRVQVPGEERFKDIPDKNKYSHPCDALQYACMYSGRPFRPERKEAPPRTPYKAASHAGY